MKHALAKKREARQEEADELIMSMFNQYAGETFDGRGRCFLTDCGIGAAEDAARYLRKYQVGEWDKRGRMRAPWRDSHRCPGCLRTIPCGSWHYKSKRCFDCAAKEKP